MKKLFLFLLLTANLCFCQTKDTISPPKNIIVTPNQIMGNADPTSIVKFQIVGDDKNIYSITVNFRGYFEQKFNSPLAKGNDGNLPILHVWCENEAKAESSKIVCTTQTVETILDSLKTRKLTMPTKTPIPVNPDVDEAQPVSTTFRYNVSILNTNFTIPIARFNFTESEDKKGEILLFNSIGAGVGISWGQFEKTTDANGETINADFSNTFGIHFGVLFSAGTNNTENKNVFAPTVSLSALDFQLGVGYEMGTIAENQKKGFITLAYAIPISKLLKGKYYIFRASKGYNSKNPLPDIPKDDSKNNQQGNTKKKHKIIRQFIQ